jgi:hypothetical protein
VREKIKRLYNFRKNFYLIKISIDRNEIFISVYIIDRARNSFLDLLGILFKVVITDKEIAKTVIFLNSITEIQVLRCTILN